MAPNMSESSAATTTAVSKHEVAIAIPAEDTATAAALQEQELDWDQSANLENLSCNNPSAIVTIGMPHSSIHGRKPPLPIFLKFVDVRSTVTIDHGAAMMSCWRRRKRKQQNIPSAAAGAAATAATLAVGKKETKSQKKAEVCKTILDGVTGVVKPGEMLAIMGPSGSGKTTLLNALAARGLHAGVSGTITYNDLPYHKTLKRRMGFVTQDDVLFPNLTVRETLIYAALLRLPNSLTRSKKIARAQDCILDLGLERCQNTVIGGPFLRGISGGERKRVCIGHEILVDPSLLYLDEPTSGLDSTIALRIIQVIKAIAQTGRTVLTTIHQPSSRLFHMFDKLILLSEGHTIYFGNARAASDYFSTKLGLVPQIPMNPADFVLDLASGNVNDVLIPSSLSQRVIKRQSSNVADSKQPPTITKLDVQEFLVNAYHRELEPDNEIRLQAEEDQTTKELRVATLEKMERSATWVQQFVVLLIRGLKERRHEYLNWLKFVQVVTLSIIVGLLWWQSKTNTETELAGQLGLVFFIAIFWGMYPLFTAIFSFPLERAMLMKERACDLYSLTAYFFARMLGDLPLDLCLPTIFLFIVYFMSNLRRTAAAFLLSLLSVYLFVIASQGLGFVVGAAMMDVKKAGTLASIITLTFMLTAGGFFVQNIPAWIGWLKYLSINNYSYRLLIKVQYSPHAQYGCGTSTGCMSIATSPPFRSISLGSGSVEVGALCIMVVVFRFLAYIALRRMKSRK